MGQIKNDVIMTILKIENVVKRFHNKTALNGANFEIKKGSIFGLLGPNGAGKTTLIRIITSILKADEGRVYLNGEELNDFHPQIIGYLPEERGLYKKMKVGEQLLYLTQLKGLSYKEAKNSVSYWVKKFEIQDWWNKKIEELSKGMQQKVQFINTVANNPQLIILDEPFTGLDPINTELIKNEILNLQKNGTTIIFSTHRMEQVEEICEDIVLINNGRVMLGGNVDDIKNDYKENLYRVKFQRDIDIDKFSELKYRQSEGGALEFQLEEGQNANGLLAELLKREEPIMSFNEVLPTLNDIFIKIVKTR